METDSGASGARTPPPPLGVVAQAQQPRFKLKALLYPFRNQTLMKPGGATVLSSQGIACTALPRHGAEAEVVLLAARAEVLPCGDVARVRPRASPRRSGASSEQQGSS